MTLPLPRALCKAGFGCLLVLGSAAVGARADWQLDDTSIAWRNGTNVVWRFSFDPKKGKPFFHPLTAPGGTALTNFKPEDHPWHYGLWFSWKYINHANYWEEDRTTGRAEGATAWSKPVIDHKDDGSAVIRLNVTYAHPSGRVDLTETREFQISAPRTDGSYSIDWTAHFTAGSEGAILDRTPMPGEPQGAVNGGYAGLGLRMAAPPLRMSVVSTAGPVDQFASDRARPNAGALACNFSDAGRDVGGIAIFSSPSNAGENAPWYIVNSDQMRFACAAILAPSIRTLPPGGKMDLYYRIAVQANAWTVASLRARLAEWTGAGVPRGGELVAQIQPPRYELGPDSLPQPGVPRGTLEGPFLFKSAIITNTVRRYWLFVPAQYTTAKPACVLVFQDGQRATRTNGDLRIPQVMENLIAKKEMPVTIGIFITPGARGEEYVENNGNPNNRSAEYDSLDDTYARFLVDEMLPEVGKKYNLTKDPDGRAIGGTSSGAICAFTVAWQRPDEFRKVISCIGSYTSIAYRPAANGRPMVPGGDLYPALIRKNPVKPIRIFLQDGSNDLNNMHGNWFLANQQMLSALEWANTEADRRNTTGPRYQVNHAWGVGAHSDNHGGAILPDTLRWLWQDYPK